MPAFPQSNERGLRSTCPPAPHPSPPPAPLPTAHRHLPSSPGPAAPPGPVPTAHTPEPLATAPGSQLCSPQSHSVSGMPHPSTRANQKPRQPELKGLLHDIVTVGQNIPSRAAGTPRPEPVRVSPTASVRCQWHRLSPAAVPPDPSAQCSQGLSWASLCRPGDNVLLLTRRAR